MADDAPVHLLPLALPPGHPIFQAICSWQFSDGFVSRLLRDDIPQRMKFGKGRFWAYIEPSKRVIVGFGTIDLCTDYRDFANNKPHPYIPLLAVHPDHRGRGYGKSILWHLIGEAALLAYRREIACHDIVFLEVYTFSSAAIALYEKCGFTKVRDDPVLDPIEQKSYFIMAKRVSIAVPA